ncbi:MAG: peptidylprolyl isomerase [Planctomycetia bacterium]|nr:peptidylprolyl isomerase [Planctomycetia bacterium]
MLCVWTLAALTLVAGLTAGQTAMAEDAAKNPVVIIDTSAGPIKVELWAGKAKGTVDNFLSYVDKKHYDGLIFHRVIDGFMIQGGGFTPEMKQLPTAPPIENEASADKANERGTIAMARTGEVNSATSQFFINLVNNKMLDHRDNSDGGFGYCAFGKVIDGMDVVDKIAKTRTGNAQGFQDVPTTPIVIKSIKRAE